MGIFGISSLRPPYPLSLSSSFPSIFHSFEFCLKNYVYRMKSTFFVSYKRRKIYQIINHGEIYDIFYQIIGVFYFAIIAVIGKGRRGGKEKRNKGGIKIDMLGWVINKIYRLEERKVYEQELNF